MASYTKGATDEENGNVADPPNYEEGNTQAPPPSYNSVFGELKAAKENSDGNVDFFKKVIGIIMGSIMTTIVLALFLAFPIAMIVIGALNLDDCPAEDYIPKWLLIMGCFGLFKNIISLIQQVVNKAREDNEKHASKNPLECILDLFLFAWFIAGSVWVYRTYKPSYSVGHENYCDEVLYLFSFWSLTLVYIFIGLSCLLCIFGSCLTVCAAAIFS